MWGDRMKAERKRLGIDQIDRETLYTVKDLLAYVPLSKSGLYKALSEMEVPCVKLGSRSLYLGKDFLTFLEECRA